MDIEVYDIDQFTYWIINIIQISRSSTHASLNGEVFVVCELLIIAKLPATAHIEVNSVCKMTFVGLCIYT